MPAIVQIRHGGEERELPLAPDSAITIGRAVGNDIVLDDPLVSRRHARLELEAGACFITDLGSANGTRVADRELAPRERQAVADRDQIEIGGFHLTYRASVESPGAQESAAPPMDRAYTFVVQPQPRLVVTTPESTREFPLEGDRLVFGRSSENDIVVDAPAISRQHAELTQSSARWTITDLNSTNGLTFDGERFATRVLADGDVIWIAESVSLTFRVALDVGREEPPSQTLELKGLREITIGRNPQADVTVTHPTVSRMHARLALRDDRYVVEDLASSNGTYVNGEPVVPGAPRHLEPGDSIRIGPVKFDFSEEALHQVDESKDLRLDALHLNQRVAKEVNLLQDISLSINAREFVAIVGVSGAGKSTLLDTLNGFRPATEGAVMVNGSNLYRNFDAYRTNLGYVPQDDIIHKELTVQSALDYSARLRLPSDMTPAERRERVEDVIQTLGLAARRDVPIVRLSGGQRKRVSIGAELLTRPALFYLDEATSGLDPGTESQMMRMLRKLADDGHTILLVTHATKNVMLCDQVVFLAAGGNLAWFGPPDEALKHFEVDDFDEIYEKLEDELSPKEWADRYLQSNAYRQNVAERLDGHYGAENPAGSAAPPAVAPAAGNLAKRPERAPRNVSMLRQFWILSSRYLSIIRRDRVNLALLFLIAPLLGAIDFAWGRDVLDPEVGSVSTSMTMLFMGSLIPFLVGALTSVREIVKESAIYRRERTVTLKIVPYLSSKIWVGFLFALYHAAAFFALKMLAVDFSQSSTADLALIYGTLAFATMSGVMWGLLISAVVPRDDQAMVLVIAVVVLQMIFSGGLLALKGLGVVGLVLGSVTSTKWVFEALTSASGVVKGECFVPPAETLANCQMPGLGPLETEPERALVVNPMIDSFGDVYGASVYEAWAALGVILVAIFVIIVFLQKRKDVV